MSSSTEFTLVDRTVTGRPCSPFTPPKVFTATNSVPHAIQGPRPAAKRPTYRIVEIFASEARQNVEEVDRWIEAARELEGKGKGVKEWKAMLEKLIGELGSVHATIIEVKTMLVQLKKDKIYDDEPVPPKIKTERQSI